MSTEFDCLKCEDQCGWDGENVCGPHCGHCGGCFDGVRCPDCNSGEPNFDPEPER